MKLSSLTPDRRISMLLKAPYGFGKTLAAASMAVEGPIFIAYWDKKTPIEVVTYFRKIGRADLLDNIEWELYGSNNAHEYLNKLMSFTRDCRYIGVITDSVTNMTSGAVNWSLGFRNPKGGQKDKVNPEAMKMIPDFDEYKVETSLITQALDISRTLPAHIIWTCHPLPSIKVEGSGASISVTKVNNIVTYGSKAGAIIPGNFTEIYHFSKRVNFQTTPSTTDYVVNTDGIGDDFAKTALNLPSELVITNRLFWDVWKEAVRKGEEAVSEVKQPVAEAVGFDPTKSTPKWKV